MRDWAALTGTPGTGKSSVAALLPHAWQPVEVGELALQLGAGRSLPHGRVRVDLRALRTKFRRWDVSPRMVVGHLAHLLPIRDTVILRCRPSELSRRLSHARLTTDRERLENIVSEAIDLILIEARNRHRRIWEVDTTGRSPRSVAGEVARLLRTRPLPRWGSIDWLSDPETTAFLLRRSP